MEKYDKFKIDNIKSLKQPTIYFWLKENGFSEAELNSLKTDFVDKGDLAGLKAKETELCVNKFKELKKIDATNVEINSTNNNGNLFFSTKANAELNNDVDDGSELFR